MRSMIHVAPRASAANRDGTGLRINTSILYRRQIDDQTVITNSKASRVVSATANGQKQVILSGKIYRADYVRHIRAAHNEPRLFVYHSIVNFAGFIITLIARLDQSSPQGCYKICNRIFVKHAE